MILTLPRHVAGNGRVLHLRCRCMAEYRNVSSRYFNYDLLAKVSSAQEAVKVYMDHLQMSKVNVTTVVAFDPGLVTGWATFCPCEGVFASGEIGFDEVLPFIEGLTHSLLEDERPADFVAERFTITTQTAKKSQAPWSLEVIGVLRAVIQERYRMELELQNVADAKRFSTNDKLDALGWRRRTKGGHADDATRHLLLKLTKSGWWDVRLNPTG